MQYDPSDRSVKAAYDRPVAGGWHPAKVAWTETKNWAAKANKPAKTAFQVTLEIPDQGPEKTPQGPSKLRFNVEDSAGARQFLSAFGFDTEKRHDLDKCGMQVRGNWCQAKVNVRKGEEKTFYNVVEIKAGPPPEGQKNPTRQATPGQGYGPSGQNGQAAQPAQGQQQPTAQPSAATPPAGDY